MSKPVAIIGPNTMQGFASDPRATPSEMNVPDYLSPELKENYGAARIVLWFKSWGDAQEFMKQFRE